LRSPDLDQASGYVPVFVGLAVIPLRAGLTIGQTGKMSGVSRLNV